MKHRFQAGGTIRPGAYYVIRQTDQQLADILSRGESCYVLGPRQIGKSSMRMRVLTMLRNHDIPCVWIDLNQIGKSVSSPQAWYSDLLQTLKNRFKALDGMSAEMDFSFFDTDMPIFDKWNRLNDTIQSGYATEMRPVIFIDEADVILTLPFPVEELYNSIFMSASTNSGNEIPVFCLLGGAAPWKRMSVTQMTPFQNGNWIRLEDFSPEEAATFHTGFEGIGGDPQKLLDEVLAYTNGHPYMIQMIGQELTERSEPSSMPERERITAVVNLLFLLRGRDENASLKYASDHFGPQARHEKSAELLDLYIEVLTKPSIPMDWQHPIYIDLWLTGMVSVRDNRLYVRNEIYGKVFDMNWVEGVRNSGSSQ